VSSTPGGRPPRTRRLTIASAVILVAGLIGGIAGITAASGAGGDHPVRVSVSYSCRFPSATNRVSAVITATFPASVASGTSIQPAGSHLTISLPHQAVAYLRGLGAASMGASGSLAVTAASGGAKVPTTWPLRTAAGAALPRTGSLTLDLSASAPAAGVSKPGTVTFTANGLALRLTPKTTSRAATTPARVAASCRAAAGSRLAVVSITSASPAPSASASTSARAGGTASTSKPLATSRIPKGCGHVKLRGVGTAVCGYIAGYSDVKKLYGATTIGPVLVNLDFAYRHTIGKRNLVAYSTGRIYNQHDKGKPVFPPVRATFLGFGFVPVTATLQLTEVGPINIVSRSGIAAPPYPIHVTAKTRVAIAISNVKVNGVRLPVGTGCRAAHVVGLTLIGNGTNTFPPRGYTVPTGGPLSGTLTIPPFIHCGVTQNLDPLLTGSISGPGNFAIMTQGKLCGPVSPQNWTCPPPIPKRHR
jgi:hypothetical protein